MKRFVFLACLIGTPLAAMDLAPPGSTIVRTESSSGGSARLPDAPWTPETVFSGTDGAVRRTVFRYPDATRTTLQLQDPLRSALEDEGFQKVFSCSDRACGGFDFRFQLDLLPEPDMHVDLGNFRYLLMARDGSDPHTVSVVSSSSATAGYVHVTEVSSFEYQQSSEEPAILSAPQRPVEDSIASLVRDGRTVLDDLVFGTGSSELGARPFDSLAELASWLGENEGARVVLVGHTDAVGSLEANTVLSRRRAEAVAKRLSGIGVDPAQLQFAGAGYLAPLSTNLSEDGRARNRRVEVVLLSLE